jgi:hypothetical protein
MDTIRVWRREGFSLRLFDTGRSRDGKTELAYAFSDTRTPDALQLFVGGEFYPSPLHADDSDETVAALLGFFSLGEGDTDSDYFDNYTERQLAWRDSARREELSLLVYEMEERDD